MSFFGKLAASGISGVVDSVSGLVGKFAGNKEAQQANLHDENMAVLGQMGDEATAQLRENRTKWDSFVDGLNRLMRPFGYFAAWGILIWVAGYPVQAAAAMIGFNAMPEWMAWGLVSIVMTPFVTRPFEKGMFRSKVTVADVAALAKTKAEILALANTPSEPEPSVATSQPVAQAPYEQLPDRLSDAAFEAELASSKPLSLPAIVEWNRRSQERSSSSN